MSDYRQILIETDDSGHEYIIPAELKSQWISLTEKINSESEYSDEWYDAIDKFSTVFEEYRLGGSIDAELYVKSDYFNDKNR